MSNNLDLPPAPTSRTFGEPARLDTGDVREGVAPPDEWTEDGVMGDGMAGVEAIAAFLDSDEEPESSPELADLSRRDRRRHRRRGRRDATAARKARRKAQRLSRRSAAPAAPAEVVAAAVEENPTIRRRVTARIRPLLLPALAVAAVAVALVWWYERRIDDVTRQQLTMDRVAVLTAEQPGTTSFDLERPDRTTVTVSVSTDGVAFVDLSTLPPLAEGYTYQIWGATSAERVSLAVVGGDPGVVSFELPAEVGSLAITAEIAGGVSASTTPSVAFGTVSADT